jgi:hypothetical protein
MVDDVLIAVEAIARGQCVLCAGSRLDGGPGLRALVGAMYGSLTEVDEAEAERMTSEEPLAAAAQVRQRMRARFDVVLRASAKAFDGPPAVPPTLASLPFRAVLTTAYGDGLEQAFAPLPVVRLLGSLTKGDVAFSIPEVDDRRREGRYKPVRELFRTCIFLFAGFEPRDPELTLVLDHILSGARGERPHLALIPGVGRPERDDLLARYNIRVVDGTLVPFVDAVARELVDTPYEEMSVSTPPEPPPVGEPPPAVVQLSLTELAAADTLEALLEKAAAEPSSTRRAEVLGELARVFEEKRKDPDRALTTLLAAFRLMPGTRFAQRIERLAETTGRWEEVAEELSGGAARSEDERVAA